MLWHRDKNNVDFIMLFSKLILFSKWLGLIIIEGRPSLIGGDWTTLRYGADEFKPTRREFSRH